MNEFCLLVVAKAPVPGFAKTRLCPPATSAQAADIAAAALLDTLDAVLATPDATPVVAITGDLGAAARHGELNSTLRRTHVISQRGNTFTERLVNAHADVALRFPDQPVLQIGMDTPQVTPTLLAVTASRLGGREAVLGPTEDGGWWALALRNPADAAALVSVPMSQEDTGVRTRQALSDLGLTIGIASRLSDVDTMASAAVVAARMPYGRFPEAVRAALGRAA